MVQNIDIKNTETALEHLGITYRSFSCRKGTIYFCTIPSTGVIFDLECRQNGAFRLWKFVGSTTSVDTGKRYEYRMPEKPHTAIGAEITNEGDISVYVEHVIAENEPQPVQCMERILAGYTEMISRMTFENSVR